jgi:SAM-dependent methyltransferase
MHNSSYLIMQNFVTQYLDRTQKLVIADIGSQVVTRQISSYRRLIDAQPWTYIGCDVTPGNNVDLVFSSMYSWKELKSGSIDVIISGQTFEHIEFFWVTMLEIARVLKVGGLCCLVAPSAGLRHRYPVDGWRYYEDGFSALARYARLDVLQVYTQRSRFDSPDFDPIWQDSVLIARKPAQSLTTRLKLWMGNRFNQFMLSGLAPIDQGIVRGLAVQLFFKIRAEDYCQQESIMQLYSQQGSEYRVIFDLREYALKNEITAIRLDPATSPIRLKLERAEIHFTDGSLVPLNITTSNGLLQPDGSLFFDHDDANLYFDWDGVTYANLDYLLFEGKITD